MNTDNLRSELASLSALISAETDSPEKALDKLADLNDPVSIRRRLAVLLRLEKVQQAHTDIRSREPHVEWVELGIRTAVRADDIALARRLVQFARVQQDLTGTLALRAVLAFGDAVLANHYRDVQGRRSIYAVEPAHQELMSEVVNDLSPFCESIVNRDAALTPVEREALSVLSLAIALLGKGQDAKGLLARLCADEGPVHPQLGQFVLEGRLPLVPRIADGLAKSSVDAFFGKLEAILLAQAERPNARRTFGALAELATVVSEHDRRGLLFSALSETALNGDEPLVQSLEPLKNQLLDLTRSDHCVRLAMHELAKDRVDDARRLLDSKPDVTDPMWLKVQSACDFATNNAKAGLGKLADAALRYLDDRWLEEAASTAFQQGSVEVSISCLLALRKYFPWRRVSRSNLARLLWHAGKHDEATTQYEQLLVLDPDNKDVALDLAKAYVSTNKPELALPILQRLCEYDGRTLAMVLLRGEVLRRIGRMSEAFEALHTWRSNFWSQKEFLFAYMDVGYATGHEFEANEALQAMNDLRRKGELDPKAMWEGSLEDVIDYSKQVQDQRRMLNERIICGEVPWTFAASVARRPTIYEWALRTQPLGWALEDQQNRAEHSIYATNGFTVGNDDDGPQLVQFAASGADTLCVDYSALITLHQLGLLPLLAKVYKSLIVPSEYRNQIQLDVRRLQPHQATRSEGNAAIKAAIEQGRIAIADPDKASPRIDEYSPLPTEPNQRPLAALLKLLDDNGQLQLAESKELRSVCQREDAGRRPLQLNARVFIDVNTLMTIYSVGCLPQVLSAVRVHITSEDKQEVFNNVAAFDHQSGVLHQLNSLWDSLATYATIRFVSPPAKQIPNADDEGGERHGDISLLSLQLAEATGAPLLIDDRCVQAAFSNKRGSPTAAFGTDALLRSLKEKGHLDMDGFTRAMLKLLEWRYKFIVLEAEALHHIAKRYAGKAAGAQLVAVARYIHECMMDPGLFGGLERTAPPTSIALRLYLTWNSRIGDFLVLVWSDPEISDERAEALTRWAAYAMVPRAPAVLTDEVQSRVAMLSRESPVINALIRVADFDPNPRITKNLKLLAGSLGLSNRQYEAIVAEVAERATT